MNKRRRKHLDRAITELVRAKSIVEVAHEEEDDCLNNIPENLESSDMYEKIETAIEHLDDAITNIDDAIKNIEEAMS